jgi:hypothetical protein
MPADFRRPGGCAAAVNCLSQANMRQLFWQEDEMFD